MKRQNDLVGQTQQTNCSLPYKENALGLSEYLVLAEKVILSYGRFVPTDDQISYVAEYMMRGDIRYKEGVGDRRLFRVSVGKFAVKGLIKQFKKRKFKESKNIVESLDFSMDYDNVKSIENIPDPKQKTPSFLFEYEELISFINKSTVFSDRERAFLKDYIDSNCKVPSKEYIREKFDTSKQNYNRIISISLEKVRLNYV